MSANQRSRFFSSEKVRPKRLSRMGLIPAKLKMLRSKLRKPYAPKNQRYIKGKMHLLDPNKTGLVVGAFLGGWHLLWAILVAAGMAQSLLDFILWAHMIHVTWTVGPFDWKAAIALITLTGRGLRLGLPVRVDME
jgi:hypothetical protein